jgi:hypothetical protein
MICLSSKEPTTEGKEMTKVVINSIYEAVKTGSRKDIKIEAKVGFDGSITATIEILGMKIKLNRK